MISKHKRFFDSNDVIIVLRIIISQMCKHIHFNISLIVKLLLVSNNLQSNKLFVLMIETFQSLSKAAFSKRRYNFESKGDVVLEHYVIVTSLIIISIIKFIPDSCIDFLCFLANEVNFFVIKNFSLFMIRKY